MDVKTKELEKNKIEVTVEVEKERFQEGINHAYKKIVGQINIPGFRKGKVPKKMIENMYGEEIFYQDAIDFVMPQAYLEAIESLDKNLQPVGKPEIDFDDDAIGQGKPFVFTAVYDIKPEAKLGQYKDFELEKIATEVTAEEIAQELENLRQSHAQLEVVAEDGAIENGDLAVFDFSGKKDGVAFDGGTAEDYTLEIGSGQFIPGFEEQMVGMKIGEEKTIDITFPEDYHAKDLAGADVTFDIKIKEAKRKVFAELDDEFAKDISEFDTLDEMKEDIRKNLSAQKENMLKSSLKAQGIVKVTENMEVEIPESMVETQIDSMIQDFDYRLRMQGMSLDRYLEFSQETEESLRKKYEDEATQAVKENLALEAIVKEENIEVNENDVEEAIQNLAEVYNQDVDKIKEMFKQQGQLESFKENLKYDKAAQFVVDNSKVVEKKEEAEEK